MTDYCNGAAVRLISVREKNMKKWLFIATLVLLSACTGPVTRWTNENFPKAKAGEMKWSEYYKQLYDRAMTANFQNKASFLDRTNLMIRAATMHEDGRLTKEEFEHMQRIAQAGDAADDEAASNRSAAAWAAGLKAMGDAYGKAGEAAMQRANSYTPPAQTKCTAFGNQLNCTSY